MGGGSQQEWAGAVFGLTNLSPKKWGSQARRGAQSPSLAPQLVSETSSGPIPTPPDPQSPGPPLQGFKSDSAGSRPALTEGRRAPQSPSLWAPGDPGLVYCVEKGREPPRLSGAVGLSLPYGRQRCSQVRAWAGVSARPRLRPHSGRDPNPASGRRSQWFPSIQPRRGIPGALHLFVKVSVMRRERCRGGGGRTGGGGLPGKAPEPWERDALPVRNQWSFSPPPPGTKQPPPPPGPEPPRPERGLPQPCPSGPPGPHAAQPQPSFGSGGFLPVGSPCPPSAPAPLGGGKGVWVLGGGAELLVDRKVTISIGGREREDLPLPSSPPQLFSRRGSTEVSSL